MKIYILLGHPDSDSYNGQLAEAYKQAAIAKGHEVRIQKIGDMQFDPILRKGYNNIQALEPDLKTAQENILWCEQWTIFYPVWWGAVPALLKGFFDRTLLPGFAFKYHEKGILWDKLLKGRKGLVVTTSDGPAWWLAWQYGNSDKKATKYATLGFCGIDPVKFVRIDNLRSSPKEYKEKWLKKMADLA